VEVDEVMENTLISFAFRRNYANDAGPPELGEGVVSLRWKELPGTSKRVASVVRKQRPKEE
jgi:hypothetical protein